MIRLRTLRTLPFSFRSLSSVSNGRVAIHRSPVFKSTQIRCFGSTQISDCALLDAEPTDHPDHYDVMLTDIDHRVLNGRVLEKLGCTYLLSAKKVLKPKPEVNGILFGRYSRPFFTLRTTYEELSYNLHFLFDTSLPFTYLSYPACEAFFKDKHMPYNIPVDLNGLRVVTHRAPAKSHFKDVNILGADFCFAYCIRVTVDYEFNSAKLDFSKFLSKGRLTNV